MSENITRILEELWKDYNKTECPSYKEGQIFQSRKTHFYFNQSGEGEHSHQVNGTNFRNEDGTISV
jgi:hypothetical protein